MKRIFTVLLVGILGVSVAFSEVRITLEELAAKVQELEAKNNELEVQLEEIKQNDGSVEVVGNDHIALQKNQWGEGFAFEFAGGTQGLYGSGMIGVIFPRIKNTISFGLRVNFNGYMGQSDAVVNGVETAFSPLALTGSLILIHSSPMLFNFIRVYGVYEVQLGYTYTPGYLTETASIYGYNLTFAALGYGGIEFYTSKWYSMFFECGGGVTKVFSDFANSKNGVQSSWNGSGFAMRFGAKVYIAE